MRGRGKGSAITKPFSPVGELKEGISPPSREQSRLSPHVSTEKPLASRDKSASSAPSASLSRTIAPGSYLKAAATPTEEKEDEHDDDLALPERTDSPESPSDDFHVVESKEEGGSPTDPSPSVPSKCVWVGNVSPEINEAQFRKYFEPFGEIELVRMFPRSKCAFVTFKKAESASKSLALEGKLVGSMCLTLNIGKASRHLWVGNIGSNVTELDLRTAFEEYGTVESVRVLRGNKCAFVNFATEGEAMSALENMNGKLLGYQRIAINFQWENSFKRPGRQRTQEGKATSRYPPGISRTFDVPSRQLFVGSIVPSVTDGTLWHLFSRFGEVEQIKGYANRGYAFIVFRSLQVAVWVREQMKLYPPTIGGRALIVNFGRQPTSNPSGEDYSYSLPAQAPLHVPAPVLPTTHQPLTATLPAHVPGTTPVSLPPQYSYPPPHSVPLPHPTLSGYVVAALPQGSTTEAPGDSLLTSPMAYSLAPSPGISPSRTLESLESELRSLTLGVPYTDGEAVSTSLGALPQTLLPLQYLQTQGADPSPRGVLTGAGVTASPYFSSTLYDTNSLGGLSLSFGLSALQSDPSLDSTLDTSDHTSSSSSSSSSSATTSKTVGVSSFDED